MIINDSQAHNTNKLLLSTFEKNASGLNLNILRVSFFWLFASRSRATREFDIHTPSSVGLLSLFVTLAFIR